MEKFALYIREFTLNTTASVTVRCKVQHPELSIILILSALVDGILYSQSVTLSTMVHWTGCVQYE